MEDPADVRMPASGAARKILVVDDQPAIRSLLGRMLARSGYAMVEAASAREAYAAIQRLHGEIVLAIIDMIMPGASGLDLASELGRDFPRIRILYMSGCRDSLAMDVIARRSPEAVLLKPFTYAELTVRLETLLAAGPEAGDPQVPKP